MSSEAQRPSGHDQRRSPRVPVPPYGGAVSVVGAQLVNVSPHGALIESLVPMEADAVMPLRLVIAGKKVDVGARVAQCAGTIAGRRRVYRIGLEFVSLPPGVKEQLVAALKPAPNPTPAA